MIDLHCHILAGVDDGARDMADSVAMARQAELDGITHVCATPHVRADHDVQAAGLAGRVGELNAELETAGVSTRILTGGEVAEARVRELSDDELTLFSFAGAGRWILIEPAPGPVSDSFVGTVEELAERGFRAVVAHPERHLDANTPALLAQVVERGALIQATAADFAEPGSELLTSLVGRGLVHVLGSDSHSAHFGRPVRISHAIGALATVPAVTPHLGWVAHTAPQAIITGADVSAPYPAR